MASAIHFKKLKCYKRRRCIVNKPKFAILGTGNSGQTFAADISLKGF